MKRKNGEGRRKQDLNKGGKITRKENIEGQKYVQHSQIGQQNIQERVDVKEIGMSPQSGIRCFFPLTKSI